MKTTGAIRVLVFLLAVVSAVGLFAFTVRSGLAQSPTFSAASWSEERFPAGSFSLDTPFALAHGSVDAISLPRASDGSFVDRSTLTSRIVEPASPFTSFAVSWKEDRPLGTSLTLNVRIRTDGAWSEWFPVEPSEDEAERGGLPSGEHDADPIMASGDAFQYRADLSTIDPSRTSRLESISLLLIDDEAAWPSDGGFLAFLRPRPAVAQTAVVSRSAWGADEDLALKWSWYYDNGAPDDSSKWTRLPAPVEISKQSSPERYPSIGRWVPEYAKPELFVLHHTAGSNGEPDPAATVRAIYFDHTVRRTFVDASGVRHYGWGDIGYNYVIDARGTVYEGRNGGDGVIGAHAFDSATNLSYNRGSVGVALLGNYQNGADPTPEALTSLERVIGEKAKLFGLDPQGSGLFSGTNTTLPRVVGHRDVDATLCPGERFYSKLPDVRLQAQLTADALPPPAETENIVTAASIQAVAPETLTLPAGEEGEVYIDVRNDGPSTWRAYLPKPPRIVVVRPDGSPSLLTASAWKPDGTAGQLVSGSVAPGGTGRFRLSVKASASNPAVTERFAVAAGDQTSALATFTVSVTSTGFPYAATLDRHTMPIADFLGSRRSVTLVFKNIGTQPWKRDDVALTISNGPSGVSRFRDASWPKDDGRFRFRETEVGPGQTATFAFTWRKPTDYGPFTNTFSLLRGSSAIPGSTFTRSTRIDSPLQLSLTASKTPPAVRVGWGIPVTLAVKNRGLINLSRNDVQLRVTNLGSDVSSFRDRTWRSATASDLLDQSSLPKGKSATFTLKLRAPKAPGLYRIAFEILPRRSGLAPIQYWPKPLVISVRVDP